MGARVFHHPLAIRVYEWVEIRPDVEIYCDEKGLQSVYMSGLK